METWKAILIGAVGTWVIAVIAVAQRSTSGWLRPKLCVERNGFSGTIVTHPDGKRARYYLMRVRNPRRIPPAHEVQLVLTRLERSGAHGPEILFDEIMPFGWIRQELSPLLTRKIGPDALSALFFVQEDDVLRFTPAAASSGVIIVYPHFHYNHQAPVTLWVTLQAVSVEADSRPIRLKIEWNGPWHAGKSEIERACPVSLDPV
jgi:hypothetical protein